VVLVGVAGSLAGIIPLSKIACLSFLWVN